MTPDNPIIDLDVRYGDPEAAPLPWPEAVATLDAAELFWLSTVRPDGRPHVTPLLAVWQRDALHFCTGAHEQKARNIENDPRCVLTTGVNALRGGTDLVVEGTAERVTDQDALVPLAARWAEKYGPDWQFAVADGAFVAEGHAAHVFRVAPTTAYAFGKAPYSQTRYRF
jgi:hypothetical protein